MTKQYYSYEEFRDDLKILIKKIDKPFDTIIGISRGGLSMAQMLGGYYDMRQVYAINSIGYDDSTKLDEVSVFNVPDLSSSQSVLIVDDIVDSGDTIVKVLEVLALAYPSLIVHTASLFYKKDAKISPTWSLHEAHTWIEFFWEVDLKEARYDFDDR